MMKRETIDGVERVGGGREETIDWMERAGGGRRKPLLGWGRREEVKEIYRLRGKDGLGWRETH